MGRGRPRSLEGIPIANEFAMYAGREPRFALVPVNKLRHFKAAFVAVEGLDVKLLVCEYLSQSISSMKMVSVSVYPEDIDRIKLKIRDLGYTVYAHPT